MDKVNMTNQSETSSQLKRALQTLKDLRARLERVERARHESIAVIGLACRFPGGGDSPEAFWKVLKNRVDGVGTVPADRWDAELLFDADADQPGKLATRWGGFLPHVDQFDAPFFGISPREATHMDPQQRLLLEVAWEAFEDAGLPVEKLAGSRTGVFVGVHSQSADYFLMQMADIDEMDIYTGTGTSHAVVSGRISYLFDLYGPNFALDTACSSSLSAVHLAVQSLRSGESDLALAGGVNVMLTPEFTMVASRMRMMASDGRCKAFDSRADGFVRGEGSGAVILKRLAEAERDGDQILAVIRGSAANQDGRSNGLTAPNGLSQQAVIRAALADAGVRPDQVSYVETHGTGTPLGDPIEVEALGEVYGKPALNGLPCVLGSVKTNVGHLEGAAGVAGLIKTVLALHHHTIPANLHYLELNPHITLAGTRLEIAADERSWESSGEPRFAGVSSFGWSGTNIHLVLEGYDGHEPTTSPAVGQKKADQPTMLPISARSPEALKSLADTYRALLQSDVSLADLCYSAATRRSHHTHRLAAVGRSAPELAGVLAAYGSDQPHPQLITGQSNENQKPGVVFIFPGQGGQWLGMGSQLYQTDPVFRQTIEACEMAFKPYVDWSLIDQLTADEAHSRLTEIDVIQPCLFAVQIGLAAALRARGITPDAVIGHSLGEVAAAFAAGALTLEDASRVICTRSRLMRRVSGKGAMATVGLSLEEADSLLINYRDRLSVAVSNGPTSTVISGDPAALEEVLARLQEEKTFFRRVKVDVAAHSPQMEPLRSELVTALAGIRPQAASVALYSTVLGRSVNGQSLDAEYWGKNLRQPVLFSTSLDRLISEGYSVFIECGPHPVLLSAIGQADRPEDHPNRTLTLLPAMRRGGDELLDLHAVLGGYYTAGGSLDWNKTLPETGRYIPLPLYPWQHKRYWVKVKQTVDPLAAWFYEVDWKYEEASDQTIQSEPGAWLVLCDPQDSLAQGQKLADQLTSHKKRVIRVIPGDEFAHTAPDDFVINPNQPEDFDRLIQVVLKNENSLQGVAYCWGMAAPTVDALDIAALQINQKIILGGALHLAQSLARTNWQSGGTPRLWIITRGAQPAAGSRPVGLAQSPLWGFGRVLAFEHPDIWGGLIDLDQDSPLPVSDLLGQADQQIAYRQGKRYLAQLVRQTQSQAASPPAVRPDASYLITGGLGGLGLKVAAWLTEQGARHLALMGRSSGSESARLAIQAIEAAGIKVLRVQGDTSSPEDMRRVLREISETLPPLRGVIHSAGLVEDALLENQTWSSFERAFAAKVPGAWNLHQCTRDLELDFFLLFSSASSILGMPGQTNYAAANAFLDALVYERRATGLPALAINWGAWGEVGLAAQQERPAILGRMGIDTFSPAKGLVALGRLMNQSQPQAMAAVMNWEKYLDQRPNGNACAFFSAVKKAESQPGPNGNNSASETETFLSQLEQADPAARLDLLTANIHDTVTRVLRFEGSEAIANDQGFFQIGMDSLMAVELKNHLQKTFGRSLRTTLAFDYPSVNQLTHYLLGELFPEQSVPETAAASTDEEIDLDHMSRSELKSMLDDELRRYENEV